MPHDCESPEHLEAARTQWREDWKRIDQRCLANEAQAKARKTAALAPLLVAADALPATPPQPVPPLPLPPTHQIPYPKTFTEFDIQAWLYVKLHRLGYDIHGEVICRRPYARFDLVIFDADQQPALLIEVKRNAARRTPRQDERSLEFGLPILSCEGTSQFRETLAHVRTIVQPTRPPATRSSSHPSQK